MHEMMEHLKNMLTKKRFELVEVSTYDGVECAAVYKRADRTIEATLHGDGTLELRSKLYRRRG